MWFRLSPPHIKQVEEPSHKVGFIVCFALFRRKYPARYSDVIPALTSHIKQVEEPSGKVSVIWMIGEYGEEDTLKDAPYILETFIDNFEEESSHEVCLMIWGSCFFLYGNQYPMSGAQAAPMESWWHLASWAFSECQVFQQEIMGPC